MKMDGARTIAVRPSTSSHEPLECRRRSFVHLRVCRRRWLACCVGHVSALAACALLQFSSFVRYSEASVRQVLSSKY